MPAQLAALCGFCSPTQLPDPRAAFRLAFASCSKTLWALLGSNPALWGDLDVRQLALPLNEESAAQEAARLSSWLAARRPALRRLRLRTAAAAAIAAALGSLEGAALEELCWTAFTAVSPREWEWTAPVPLPTAALAGPRLRELRLKAAHNRLDAELASCSALTLLHAESRGMLQGTPVSCAPGLVLPPALRELQLRDIAWDAAAAAALASTACLTSLCLSLPHEGTLDSDDEGSPGQHSSGDGGGSLAAVVARTLGALRTLRQLAFYHPGMRRAPRDALLPLATLCGLEDLSLFPPVAISTGGGAATALLCEPGFGAALTRLQLGYLDLPCIPRGLLAMERLCHLELHFCKIPTPDGAGGEEPGLSLQVTGAAPGWEASSSSSGLGL